MPIDPSSVTSRGAAASAARASNALNIAQRLIRCESVTPNEGGAIALVAQILRERAGFIGHRLAYGGPDDPHSAAPGAPNDPVIDNVFARLGDTGPHLCFAGHTDVVPVGDEATWSQPPFAASVVEGQLYGRGTVDMKGGVAAFMAAALDWAARTDPRVTGRPRPGSISFLITGDEEGPGINGTARVLDWMAEHGHIPDACVVGEPTNPTQIGDEIKIGRRGSLSGRMILRGKQGHVAYPHLANSPIPALTKALDALIATPLDAGTVHFQPSNLEVTTVQIDNQADNIIPAVVEAKFNVRFNDTWNHASLADEIRRRAAIAIADYVGISHELTFWGSSQVFLTENPQLVETMQAAVHSVTGRTAKLSTAGGTSDARYISRVCPVIEFGLINQTMHQVDERVDVTQLDELTEVYSDFIDRWFASAQG